MDRMELVWLWHVVLIHVQHVAAVTWLYLAKQTSLQAVLRDPRGCDGLTGLVEEQVRVCRWQVEAMEAVKRGAELAVLECQHQFHSYQWNRSTLQELQVFGKVVIQGTRESAFIHAISAASIAFAVTRACSHGELRKCGYNHKIRGVIPEGFQWSGCSDNLSCRIAFSQAFVDSPERSRGVSSSRALMNLPSNEVARKVGNVLKEKFEGEMEVYLKRVGSYKLLVPRSSRFKPHTAHNLVYLLPSPDFCEQDPWRGIFGTSGRQCNWTWLGTDGCELLCCARAFHTAWAQLEQRCSCKFRCCCSVKCKQCRHLMEVHRCR